MGQTSTASIIFSGSEDKSVTELGGAMPLVKNAIPDASGALRRRPAANSPYFGNDPFQPAIIGMTAFKNWLVAVTEDRRIFAYDIDFAVLPVMLTDDATPDSFLAGTGRPSMIATRNMVLIAGGAQIQKWDGITALSQRLQNLGDGVDPAPAYPPPDGSFIAAIAQRLVVQVPGNSGQIHWSGPLENYENWDYALGGAQYTQAAAKPDPLAAMLDNTNEVFTFGKETIQVFTFNDLSIDPLDSTNSLDLSPSRTQNIGTISPYSIVAVDDNFAMLDRQRRFILTDGRTYQDIGKPVAQILRDLTSIVDCWGFRMRFGRFDCIVWFFPTDGFGLVYDMASQRWSEWSYSTTLGGTAPETITSAYNWAEKSTFVIGSSHGNILTLDDASTTDGSAGPYTSPIAVEVISGFTDHGTQAQKLCRTLMLKFKRTYTKLSDSRLEYGGVGSGHVRLSMRDDQGTWEHVRDIELSDDPNPCEQIRSLGVYRTRQWKVEYTGADEIQLVGAQEEYEVLGA